MGKLTQLLSHPIELRSVLILKYIQKNPYEVNVDSNPTLKKCYELLSKTSRSFAMVIKQLHPELKDVVMIFYLILRALDTVEDDMSIDSKIKIPLLRNFHEKLLLKDWTFDGNADTEKDKCVLVEFDQILKIYHTFKPEYKEVLSDITLKMGNGMADYILDDNFNLNGVETVKDYDLYCHYVAGLVGEGLTRLMVLAGFAKESLLKDPNDMRLMESMGLFLQKVNITRDYYEDLLDKRSFWPKEIWSKYAENLKDLHEPENVDNGVYCLNELVLNALSHVTDVLNYLSSINEQTSYQFCCIPQVMAIATMSLIFNNKDILSKVNIKIRKSETCYLILKSRTFKGTLEIFDYYLKSIKSRLQVEDPNYLKLNIQIAKIQQYMEGMTQDNLPEGIKPKQTDVYLKTQKKLTVDDKKMEVIIREEQAILNSASVAVAAVIIYALIKLFK
ncbi:farnesyl-diphosphate farnesyltransferase [Hanseniaspora valbyensis NRRL Y-1626]|uniref:Squalene synthase n=1 Tax=Hanseniaspora valbyensis NRRL Y-1626 TaxID=766949 RepID=A0A1B7TBB5_9ASCO|nr:farnesyl-diphosphate farnesyltransferase [Hanseniaspora valbyensis NRRL Y-1626]